MTPRSNYFLKQPQFKFSLGSTLIFIFLSLVAWGIYFFSQVGFPSQNLTPYLIRTAIILIVDVFVIYLSGRLLRRNGLPAQALGFSVTNSSITDVLVGALIGFLTVVIIATLLYSFVPYHFVKGTLGISQLFKAGISYLAGNALEELLFRGFLFVVLSQLSGWRISMVIIALLFGLFHLPGLGFTVPGMKMVATTALFSFIFSLSYVLTKSLWTAICTHATSNIFLHAFAGLDGGGKAMFLPEFERNWPKSYDLGFWVAVVDAVIVSFLLYMIILWREKNREKKKIL